jgi:hypothetical protein
MGSFSDSLFGKRKKIDRGYINELMAPTQGLITEQLGMSRDMMDPNSQMNMRMRNLMAQRASESGAQVGQQMQKMGAMTGMSSGQAMMQSRMGMNQAMGGVNQQWQQGLQGQQSQGIGLMGQMTGMQQQMNEGQVNAYVGEINAANAARAQNKGLAMGLLGGIVSGFTGRMGQASTGMTSAAAGGSDIALKENIELVGKSPKGVNIYEFDYKKKSYGKGRYRGVMAQEVPNASFKHKDGYLWVDYNKVDVDFERIN